MFDALGDDAHAVPDDEDAGRHRNALAGVDQDAVARGDAPTRAAKVKPN